MLGNTWNPQVKPNYLDEISENDPQIQREKKK